MTADGFARCITSMRGGEYAYSRQQLADLYRTLHERSDGAAEFQQRVREVLAARGPMTAAQVAQSLDTYAQRARAALQRDPAIVAIAGKSPALYRMKS